tara:strand:+ start:4852 stop:5235 length:384 start_codon:yes stop_codon:yes gene_type:complete
MGDFDIDRSPSEIRVKREERCIEIDFEDGKSFRLPAELLRVESPSAEVQGHGPSQKKIIDQRRHVGIMKVEAVGHYAIRITFDDLHDTGIYSWDYLYHLGENQAEIWQTYLDKLEEKGLSRDPKRRH